jgi:stage III sporulation protein SpoIIIAA
MISNSESSSIRQAREQSEAKQYLAVIPPVLRSAIREHLPLLLEVRLDVGRLAVAVLTDGRQVKIGATVVTRAQIEAVVAKTGPFDAENRAALDGNLHRFSRILNRRGQAIGITLAFGRPLIGHLQQRVAEFIAKVVERRRASIAILGIGGSGKTTHLRHAAFACGEFLGSSAVVVDTSGEVGGDGDVPHWSLGEARRFLVSQPERQMNVMIEVVQNHRPRVMFVDEIGTTIEAKAAKTIKNRGCPLVFTVHAASLIGLVNNDDLNLLTGGRRHVTVGDERAALKAGKKIEEERVTEAVADTAVLIVDFHTAFIYHDVQKAVDLLLAGKGDQIEVELVTDRPSETFKFRDRQSYKIKLLEEALAR